MKERFTEKASYTISHMAEIASELGHTYIGSEHLVQSLLETEMSATSHIFKKHGVTKENFRQAICDYSGTGVESDVGAADMTPRCRRILERSHAFAAKFGALLIGTEHILCAIVDERDCIAMRLLKSLGVNHAALREDLNATLKSRAYENSSKKQDAPTLKQFGKDFTELARQNKFDPVIGRDQEMDRLIRVLCRKNKNNPCLIGEAGVGKSAIVEGLATRIANGDVPESLRGVSIVSVDLTSMVAGAKYRGDFEDRIKNIVKEASSSKSIILFIDEIHTIVGAGAAEGAIDASNILKPQLSRGELRVIGATTFSEYRRYIEKDPALERRFQPITVDEPTPEESILMLMGIKERYETHHGVIIDKRAVSACVELSVKYMSDRFLPDKAIDIMDEACAYASSKALENNKILKTDKNIEQKYNALEDVVLSQGLDAALEISADSSCSEIVESDLLPVDSEKQIVVGEGDVKRIISEISGIALCDIRSGVDYALLERSLSAKVIGQSAAIKRIVDAMKRTHAGLVDSERPRAMFLFIGESGVGKTALAAAMATEFFQNENALLRFDMTEFSEKHTVSKLIGAPPGYTGYENGGVLTEAVRKRPNALVLFDEIEKADNEVQNLFLQIADRGYLTDSSGRRVSFRNTVIVMTSNVGGVLGRTRHVGFTGENSANSPFTTDFSRFFSYEFLNRFDEIIEFESLSEKTLCEIAANRLEKLTEMLHKMGVRLTYDNDVVRFIVKSGENKNMGARAILRYIASDIENAISDYLVQNGDIEELVISVSGGAIRVVAHENEVWRDEMKI